MNFKDLIHTFRQTHDILQLRAVKAINISLTIRNWLYGYYIVEFEQSGSDRARYGEFLLKKLAEKLEKCNISNTNERELRRYRLFYQRYPQMATPILLKLEETEIRGTLSPVLIRPQIRGTSSPGLNESKQVNAPEKLFVSKYLVELPS